MKLLTVLLLAQVATAHQESSYFPGFGFSWYDPVCGNACYTILSTAHLACSPHVHGGHSHGSDTTSAECRANDTPFLTSLALCMNSTCNADNVEPWKRERFWETSITGNISILPKWSWAQSLSQITETPTVVFNTSSMDILDQTVIVAAEDYEIQGRFMAMFDRIEKRQVTYIFVLVTVGFGTPILLAVLARLPCTSRLFDTLRPYLVYPSLIKDYSVRPLPWLLGNAPTVGQALYIAMFVVLNVVLTAVKYESSQPMPWGFGPREEILAYIGYRTGHIGYALLPLLILFSGRNNFLLWITDWSYSTYILLHRWIARIFGLHAIIHSIVLLLTYQGTGDFATDSKEPYWLWGIVATVLTCGMLVLSHLYFRRLSYEFFLLLHIVLAVFVIVGCWYHVVLNFGHNFYDNWLYAACAVWFFDRLVRVLRMAKNGIRRAVITDVGQSHVRVDVQDLPWASQPGAVVYVYFPTLIPWRPWENHPFSVNSTGLFVSHKSESSTSSLQSLPDNDRSTVKEPVERVKEVAKARVEAINTSGITLIIKKQTGLTKHLRNHSLLSCLVEGPYPQRKPEEVLKCDRVLLIGGGIGITGLLAWTQMHPNIKFAWSIKSRHEALIHETENALQSIQEKEILIGQRLDLKRLLIDETHAGYKRVGVVVCGPGGMCDEVRAIVAGLGRGSKTVFQLEVDAFSW